MQKNTFKASVHEALSVTPISGRLRSARAIVLERIARGGGATKWYCCSRPDDLEKMECQLRPGSVVSFYFDERIRRDIYSRQIDARVEKILVETGEVLVGPLSPDGLHIDITIINDTDELGELLSSIAPGTYIFYGVFPARDNDGLGAVTLTVPDIDGVVRAHPH